MKQAKADALHYFLRVVYLCVGLLIMAVGVGFSIRADLGTSPISSVPYTLSLLCAPLTVGEITILMHCVFILIQILLLRRRYELLQLLQLPVAVVFGVLTDFGVWLTEQIPCDAYWQQWILCLVGVVLVAVGVSIEVTAQVVTLAGEGLVLAICKAFPKLKFGTMKVAFDVTLVVIACVCGLVGLHTLAGVREGTVAAALLVGTIARRLNRPFGRFAAQVLHVPAAPGTAGAANPSSHA